MDNDNDNSGNVVSMVGRIGVAVLITPEEGGELVAPEDEGELITHRTLMDREYKSLLERKLEILHARLHLAQDEVAYLEKDIAWVEGFLRKPL